MTEPESDADLVGRIATNDGASEAEAELCRRFAPRIRSYGLRHLRSEERARDLVQAVLLAVLVAARAGRVEHPEHVDRFVLGTSRNISQRMRRGEERLIPVGEEELDVSSFVPELEILDTGGLIRCLSRLEERARMVILWSFQEERPPREIAEALATTLGNVRVLRHRAIVDLRRCMEGAR